MTRRLQAYLIAYEHEIGIFLLIVWAGLAILSGARHWGWGWTMAFAWFAGERWAALGLER